MTTERELCFERDGKRIFGTLYVEETGERMPVLILCHGYGGDARGEAGFARYFADRGFAAYAFDFIGGGNGSRSEGSPAEMSVLTEERDLMAVIDGIREGTLTPTPQPEEGACYAAKIGREDAALDFDAPARSVFNRIRALNPSPCAVVKLPNGDPLKITASKPASAEECEKALGQFPGTVVLAEGQGEGRIVVACREGAVALTGVIPAGRKPMSAGDFVRGRKIAAGDILTVMKEE